MYLLDNPLGNFIKTKKKTYNFLCTSPIKEIILPCKSIASYFIPLSRALSIFRKIKQYVSTGKSIPSIWLRSFRPVTPCLPSITSKTYSFFGIEWKFPCNRRTSTTQIFLECAQRIVNKSYENVVVTLYSSSMTLILFVNSFHFNKFHGIFIMAMERNQSIRLNKQDSCVQCCRVHVHVHCSCFRSKTEEQNLLLIFGFGIVITVRIYALNWMRRKKKSKKKEFSTS